MNLSSLLLQASLQLSQLSLRNAQAAPQEDHQAACHRALSQQSDLPLDIQMDLVNQEMRRNPQHDMPSLDAQGRIPLADADAVVGQVERYMDDEASGDSDVGDEHGTGQTALSGLVCDREDLSLAVERATMLNDEGLYCDTSDIADVNLHLFSSVRSDLISPILRVAAFMDL